MMRALRYWWGTGERGFSTQTARFESGRQLVSGYYLANAYVALQVCADWRTYDSLVGFQPLWPVRWVSLLDWPQAGLLLVFAQLVSALAAAAWPHRRACRVFNAICLLQSTAFLFSYGAVSHSYHVWLWLAIVFAFLPTTPANSTPPRRVRQHYLQVLWFSQCLVLLFYSMAGGAKLLMGAYQYWQGAPSIFQSEALVRHIANQQLTTGDVAVVSDAMLAVPQSLSHIAILAAVLLEAAAIGVALVPRLHRPFGWALVAMHIGIGCLLDVWFVLHMFAVLLLLAKSPFHLNTSPVTAKLPARHRVTRTTALAQPQ